MIDQLTPAAEEILRKCASPQGWGTQRDHQTAHSAGEAFSGLTLLFQRVAIMRPTKLPANRTHGIASI